MNIEKIDNEIEENYLYLMKDEESKNKSYIYKAWFISLIFIWLYIYFDKSILLYISILIIFSIFAWMYKLKWFKDWYKYWYLRWKNINLVEYNT